MTLILLACFVRCCRVSLFVTSFFPPRRPYAGTFFLAFVLLRPCSSCLFLFSTYVFLFVLFFGLMPVSSSSSSCCFARAAVICSSSARMHVCCSCSFSDLASHYSEILSFFVFCFCLFRSYVGIFFVVFVLFRPYSSYLFLFIQHVYCFLASHSSELLSALLSI